MRRSRKFLNSVSFGLAFCFAASLGNADAQTKSLSFRDKNGRQILVYNQSHALVIWAGEYQPLQWNRLTNIQKEARDVGAALIRQGFAITTVANPTGKQLRQAIQDFINNYGYTADNRLVIYFAGHGWTRNNSKGYLVPVDAPDPAKNAQSEQAFLKVALDMDQIESWAKQIEAKHVLFVFDSCFSGTIFKLRSAPIAPLYIESVMNKPVRQFLTAGDADQKVPAKSIFTPLFIRGIEGAADLMKDGYVTGSELGLYLKQNLERYTKTQTPQFGTIRDPDLDQGDIVFLALNGLNNSEIDRNALPYDQKSNQVEARLIDGDYKQNSSMNPLTQPLPPQRPERPSPSYDKKDLPTPGHLKPQTSLISSSSGVDYSQLQILLSNGTFQEADDLTLKLLLTAARRRNQDWTGRDWMEPNDIQSIACIDLEIVDNLWARYTNNEQGLSVQLRIWNDIRSRSSNILETYIGFARSVKWLPPSNAASGNNYISKNWITYRIPPTGHLPVQLTYPLADGWSIGGSYTNRHLLYVHYGRCKKQG
jgi:hypothetical protein